MPFNVQSNSRFFKPTATTVDNALINRAVEAGKQGQTIKFSAWEKFLNLFRPNDRVKAANLFNEMQRNFKSYRDTYSLAERGDHRARVLEIFDELKGMATENGADIFRDTRNSDGYITKLEIFAFDDDNDDGTSSEDKLLAQRECPLQSPAPLTFEFEM